VELAPTLSQFCLIAAKTEAIVLRGAALRLRLVAVATAAIQSATNNIGYLSVQPHEIGPMAQAGRFLVDVAPSTAGITEEVCARILIGVARAQLKVSQNMSK
jgi:hypothetical protein